MPQELPHPEALDNFERAYIPEDEIRRYALRDPDKSRVFGALGFCEEAGNWEALRGAILAQLPRHPATYDKQNKWGTYYEVNMLVNGPSGKEAPVRTYWIYRWGEDFPRLATLFINTREWRHWEKERGNVAGS
jgi:hypothetical protein